MTKDVTFSGALTALLVISAMILAGIGIIFSPLFFWVKCLVGAGYCFLLAFYFVISTNGDD